MTDGSAAFGLSQTRPRSFTSDVLLDQLVSETSSKFYVNTEEVRFTMLWWCEWGEGVGEGVGEGLGRECGGGGGRAAAFPSPLLEILRRRRKWIKYTYNG